MLNCRMLIAEALHATLICPQTIPRVVLRMSPGAVLARAPVRLVLEFVTHPVLILSDNVRDGFRDHIASGDPLEQLIQQLACDPTNRQSEAGIFNSIFNS